jgi:hypothetical protein
MKENNIFYVYIHISKETDIPFYIGFGQKNRISVKTKRSLEWQEIVKNEDYYYGFLKKNMTREDANEYEKLCIKTFKNIGFNLVNKINGGSGNSNRKKYSPEYIKILSERSREYWNSISDEDRIEFSKKVSSALKGKKKQKMSDKHKENQSISHKGQIPWNKNKRNIYSKETLELISKNNVHNKKINVSLSSGEYVGEFISISETARCLKLSRSKISKILIGMIKKNDTGYIFEYKEINNKNED